MCIHCGTRANCGVRNCSTAISSRTFLVLSTWARWSDSLLVTRLAQWEMETATALTSTKQ